VSVELSGVEDDLDWNGVGATCDLERTQTVGQSSSIDGPQEFLTVAPSSCGLER
jgi:hypothetical protein